MNEKEAWLEIAETYDTPRTDRNDKQTYLAAYGICAAIAVVGVDLPTFNRMEKKIEAALEGKTYFCDYNEASDKFRAEYCHHQASLL